MEALGIAVTYLIMTVLVWAYYSFALFFAKDKDLEMLRKSHPAWKHLLRTLVLGIFWPITITYTIIMSAKRTANK